MTLNKFRYRRVDAYLSYTEWISNQIHIINDIISSKCMQPYSKVVETNEKRFRNIDYSVSFYHDWFIQRYVHFMMNKIYIELH